MPTVSAANFENEDLLSSRLLSFMTGSDQLAVGCDANGTKFITSVTFGSSVGPLTDAELNGSNNVRSPLHRNGTNSTNVTIQDRGFTGSSNDVTSLNGFVSGSCTPPLSSMHPSSSLQSNYVPMRNHSGAPPYSAVASPCLSNKLNPGAGVQQLLGPNEYHSLQNSPFYNHYSMNGNIPAPMHRQLGGISPGPMGSVMPNGVSPRNGFYQDLAYSMSSNGMRTLTPANGGCPQRELFPASNQNGTQCGSSIFGSGLLMQDRLHYYSLAQKYGFIVGGELERVKENSCRSTSQSYGRIAAHFRHRYGETEAKTKASYLQIGVRVPSKDHVSEIVGKGGQKIKLIREETGALITTPGEHEEHVFIIEAPPEIAMRVAHHLTARAQEITQSKLAAGERRRGSTSSQPSSGLEQTNGLSTNYAAHNGSTSNLLTNGSSTSVVLPLSSSATNSPLHPNMAGVLPCTTPNGTNAILRNPSVGGLFNSSQLSSLPSSPCTSSANTSQNNGGSLFMGSAPSGSRVLLARSRISVPQDMVGKIIGTQGSIITTIQKDTGTEIKSPPKEAARGPNATSEFEISAYQGLGLTSNQAAECRVQQAKQLIGHLVMRQLERRASEEIDETSGSSDEQRHVTNGPSSTTKSATWMWPDVAQMDSQEAREVLDRILAESKNKTRRVKELAAAAAVGGTAGGSPGAGSMLGGMPGSLIAGGMLNPDAFNHNQGLFDPADASECAAGEYGLRDDLNLPGLFSPVNRFMKRNSSLTLVDESSFNRGPQAPCSPRTVGAFNLPVTNPDLAMNSYNHRISSNRGPDMWNLSNSGFNVPTSPLAHTTNRSYDSFHAYMNPPTSNTNLFQNGTNDTLRKQTSLTNGYACLKSSGFQDSCTSASFFNFPDGTNGLSSGFASGGDLSPTTLLHNNNARPPFESSTHHHQTLSRRHSDWAVPTDLSNFRSGLVPPESTALDGTARPGGFDFLKALDQLCLNSTNPSEASGGGSLLAESLGSQTNSSNGSHVGVSAFHCPPGFESIPPSTSVHDVANADGLSDLNDFCPVTPLTSAAAGPWSESATTLFLPPPSSTEAVTTAAVAADSVHSTSSSKISVLQRLFHQPSNNQTTPDNEILCTTSAHLNSIWSPTADCSSRVITSSSHPEHQFLSYFNPKDLNTDQLQQEAITNQDIISASENLLIPNGGAGGDMNRICGTIGEGRRRRQNPSNELDSIVPLSVSTSVINSITEVA